VVYFNDEQSSNTYMEPAAQPALGAGVGLPTMS